ncbi:MAG TPA: M1 family metallopeptidase [Candidatus Krumholzibacteria bacterium]|nr:M1 family metallopeptidase [Candidatus Krumholzibacteria bacterium]
MSRRDPHSYADLDQGRVTHVDLDLDLDFATSRITGRARLDLAAPTQGPFDLDTRDLEIRSVKTDGGADVPFGLDVRDSILGAKLTAQLPAGTRALVIEYLTSPEASALQWLEPSMTAGGKHPYLFSQCQAIHARSVLPCQDSPLCRFTFAARMTVPEALTVVMAAAPGEAGPGPRAGTRTFAFTMPQSIPPYLFAFAAGNLVSRDLGPRSRVYTEPEMLEASAWEFADVDAMLLAAEEIFGPYLWDRFDFVVMPPSFPYGGMENPRLTFLTPTLLAGDRSLVNVLAHELAHSWTGNLVTNATIDDFWLNEGFTVWAERRILEKLEGKEAMALAAAIGRRGLDEAIEQFGATSPFTRLKTDSWGADPDEFYSQVPYEKGYLLVALLEQTVGREAFDAFVKKYIETFSFTSITTEQFEDFLAANLPGVGAKVGAEGWIRGEGVPANAPAFTSAKLGSLQQLAGGWKDGARPDAATVAGWSATDWQIYLQGLPRDLGRDGCAWLDAQFKLNTAGNSEILCNWLGLAVGNGYEPAYAKAAEFVGRVGRMKYLKPLYTALHGNKAARPLAAETFRRHAAGYHPIARGGIERILAS